MTVEVLVPKVRSAVRQVRRAARPHSLNGLTIAFLDNTRSNAGVLLEEIAELLVRRHGITPITAVKPPNAGGKVAPADLLDGLAARAHAVVTALGS